MVSGRLRTLVAGACALGIGLLVALPSSLPAAAATGPAAFRPGRALFDVGVHSGVTRAQARAASAASSTFTQFTDSVTVGTTSYTYVMAGKNPAIKVANASSTINTKLVPIVIKFSNGDTWNPAKTDSCDSGASPLTRVQKSPIFASRSWTWGGTSIGNRQVTNAYQRADFWSYAQPSGINPTYGIRLSLATLKPVTIHVPNADAAVATIGCGNHRLGAVEISWLQNYLQTKVIPSLASQGVSPAALPIFLLHNVVEFIGTTSNCCVLGYHNAYTTSGGGIQTYGLAMYDNSKAFTGSHDITALSHEVAEWQNDPYTNNPTPAWGNIGQVTGCQNNLEVGDPLTGTTFKAKLNGFTYHPQQLAFFSWFYDQSPSLGVNSWYSDQGTFTTFAAPCA